MIHSGGALAYNLAVSLDAHAERIIPGSETSITASGAWRKTSEPVLNRLCCLSMAAVHVDFVRADWISRPIGRGSPGTQLRDNVVDVRSWQMSMIGTGLGGNSAMRPDHGQVEPVHQNGRRSGPTPATVAVRERFAPDVRPASPAGEPLCPFGPAGSRALRDARAPVAPPPRARCEASEARTSARRRHRANQCGEP